MYYSVGGSTDASVSLGYYGLVFLLAVLDAWAGVKLFNNVEFADRLLSVISPLQFVAALICFFLLLAGARGQGI